MAFNLVQNTDGSAEFEASGASANTEFRFNFNGTQNAGFGRGSADTDRTYVILQDSNGTDRYLYTTDGSVLTITSVRP